MGRGTKQGTGEAKSQMLHTYSLFPPALCFKVTGKSEGCHTIEMLRVHAAMSPVSSHRHLNVLCERGVEWWLLTDPEGASR